ncbi:MAG: 2-oxoacid:acceptor oxidoreductase family protein [Phycisphaerae bacterium]
MAFHYELRFVGIGGQGNMLAGTIFAETAIQYEHRFATQVPTYTSQVRGGPTKADVIIADEPIEFPESTHVDFMLALDQRTYDMYKSDLKNRALVLVDNNLVRVPVRDQENWDVYGFPIISTAKYEIGNVMTANILAVGMTVELTGVLARDSVRKTIQSRIKPALLEINMKAFDKGLDVAKSLRIKKLEQRATPVLLSGHLSEPEFTAASSEPTRTV